MNHRIQCRCGAVFGEVTHTQAAMRAVCYCSDCRAYAIHLGQAQAVLDAAGGTDVVATQARYVSLTGGLEHLACLSLTDNGALRWYARCCNTPLANTPRDWRLPYAGVVHTCLVKPLETTFPSVQMRVNTKRATGAVPASPRHPWRSLLRFMPQFVVARVTGSYRQTPFFSASGAPRVDVQVLSAAEREAAKRAAGYKDPGFRH